MRGVLPGPAKELTRNMQRSSLDMNASRRDFLRAAARHVSLAALLAAVAWLVLRKRVDASASGCGKNRFCGDCARLRFCPLPPAPAARLALKSLKS
jgi:hypothetical protein